MLLNLETAQMLLHDLEMIRLPQPFILLLMVINHGLEEVNLRLTGKVFLTVHLPGAEFSRYFREGRAEVMPGHGAAQAIFLQTQRSGTGVDKRCRACRAAF